MRKILTGLLLLVAAGLFSCTKSHSEKVTEIVMHETIVMNQGWTYAFADNGPDVRASIAVQPAHAQENLLDDQHTPGKLTYRYRPANGYSGTDVVELHVTGNKRSGGSSSCGGGGGHAGKQIIRINFTIQK